MVEKVYVEKPSSESKWLISLMSGIIFMIIAAPYTFNLVQTIVGDPLRLVFIKDGSPTLIGLLVHGIVYTLIVRLMMVN